MALCIKVEKKKAEAARKKLLAQELFDASFSPASEGDFVFFPVKKAPKGFECVEKPLAKSKRTPQSLEAALEGILTTEEMKSLVHSFDVIGDIAIIEVPEELSKKKKQIGAALLKTNPFLRLVVRKASARKGAFRIRELETLAGKGGTEATHKEYGMSFKLDVAKAYFSPRLAGERQRVALQVKEGERVLVLFAGVGPFAIAIAKHAPDAKIVGIELNPDAVEYFKKNIRLNKAWNTEAICGDVAEAVPKRFASWADRVLMPLPKGGEAFLKEAFLAAKPGASIHFYSFAPEAEPFAEAWKKVEEAAKAAGRKTKKLGEKIVHPYAPRVVQVVLDFKAL